MKRFFLIFFVLLISSASFAGEDSSIGKYRFNFYEIVKGKKIKNFERPNYGFRELSKFPLHVKEFTFSARYLDYKNDYIKKACDEVLSGIKKWRHKNAYHLVNGIYDYIVKNIDDRPCPEEMTDSMASIYYSGAKTYREKKGCELEKCRLAVAMMRYFTIPARIVGYKGGYAVEYFLKPLKGDSRWILMSFSEGLEIKGDFIEPMEWNPVDSKELLAHKVKSGKAFLKIIGERRFYLKKDNDSALAKFENLISEDHAPKEDYKGERNFFIIREVEYELWLSKDATKDNPAEIDVVMPFNNRDTFKDRNDKGTMLTGKFYVKPVDPELNIYYKRAYTRMNPPQRGMVYHLPMKVWIEKP